MIEFRFIATPLGELEGAPALEVVADHEFKPGDLVRGVLAHERPGVSVIWIAKAPWGLTDWDQEVRFLLEADALSHVVVMAIQPLGASRWSGLSRIQWVVDLTDLLREPLTEARMVKYLEGVSFIPAVREVVIMDPAPINVQPAILDGLFQFLHPEAGGYVYVPIGDGERTVAQLSRCSYLWAQRYTRPRSKGAPDGP